MRPCGVCPACTVTEGWRTECDRVLEAKLLKSLAPIFDLLKDPSIPPPMPVLELAKRSREAA